MNEKYISVDIESSGPIPGEYSLLSIGACVVGEKSSSFYIEVKPISKTYLPQALAVSGLNLEKLKKSGIEPATAMVKFEQWIKKVCNEKRPVFVAFNATFDWMFTHYYFIKYLSRDPFGISGIDIKAYYMGKLNVSWAETIKKRIAAKFTPSTSHTHHALDDAIEQAEIFEKLLAHST